MIDNKLQLTLHLIIVRGACKLNHGTEKIAYNISRPFRRFSLRISSDWYYLEPSSISYLKIKLPREIELTKFLRMN